MKTKWISWINGLLGLLLLIAPFSLVTPVAFGFPNSRAAFWNSVVTGAFIAALAFWEALHAEDPDISLSVSVLGIWMMFSPYLIGYSVLRSLSLSHMTLGLIVTALATDQMVQMRSRWHSKKEMKRSH